jgi:hypothetical protein
MRSGIRLLRVATKIKGVQMVVTALRKLTPDLMNVLLVGLLFYYIFSVSATVSHVCCVVCAVSCCELRFR